MKVLKLAAVGVLGLMFSLSAMAQDPIDALAEACADDKAKFCSQVTPGDPERMLACAYAHEDKLSGQCSFALYQAAAALEQASAALAYLADACMDDAEEFCADVQLGEGRVLDCLMENKDNIGETCTAAMKQTIVME